MYHVGHGKPNLLYIGSKCKPNNQSNLHHILDKFNYRELNSTLKRCKKRRCSRRWSSTCPPVTVGRCLTKIFWTGMEIVSFWLWMAWLDWCLVYAVTGARYDEPEIGVCGRVVSFFKSGLWEVIVLNIERLAIFDLRNVDSNTPKLPQQPLFIPTFFKQPFNQSSLNQTTLLTHLSSKERLILHRWNNRRERTKEKHTTHTGCAKSTRKNVPKQRKMSEFWIRVFHDFPFWFELWIESLNSIGGRNVFRKSNSIFWKARIVLHQMLHGKSL